MSVLGRMRVPKGGRSGDFPICWQNISIMLSNELISVRRRVYESPDVVKFIRQPRKIPSTLFALFYHPQQDHVIKALEPWESDKTACRANQPARINLPRKAGSQRKRGIIQCGWLERKSDLDTLWRIRRCLFALLPGHLHTQSCLVVTDIDPT